MKNFIQWIGIGLFVLTFLLVGSIWLFPSLKKNDAKSVVAQLYRYEKEHGQFPNFLQDIGISGNKYTYTASGACLEEFELAYMNGLTLISYSSNENKWWND